MESANTGPPRREYLNPPIEEAVCEIRLPADTPWDITVPGLLYDRLRDEYPEKERRVFQETGIVPTEEGVQQQFRMQERAVFLSKERSISVQVGSQLLAVSSLRPYAGWPAFRQAIRSAVESFYSVVEFDVLQRIGLRYINRIQIPGPPGEELAMEDVFNIYPHFGSTLPQAMSHFVMAVNFDFDGGRDQVRVQLGDAIPPELGVGTFLLDFDYYLGAPQHMAAHQALDWIDSSHGRIGEMFEASITDRLRGLFNEANP